MNARLMDVARAAAPPLATIARRQDRLRPCPPLNQLGSMPLGYVLRLDLLPQTIPNLFHEVQAIADAHLVDAERIDANSHRGAPTE